MLRSCRRVVTSPASHLAAVGGLSSRSFTRSFTASGLIRSVADGGDKAPVYSLSDFPVAIDELTINTVATSEAVVNAVVAHELTWRPPDMVMWLIDNIHVVYEIPYWESIVVTTLGLRFLMLPLAIKTMQNASRMAVLRPHMQRTQEEFLKDPRYEEMDVKIKYQNDIKALFKEHKVNPFRSLLMPLAQIPVFLSFFLGLREMGTHFPDMATGGAFWFVDLSVADPYCIFPVLNAVSFLFMIEMSAADGGPNASPQQQSMLWIFRGLALAMGPLTMTIPQSVFVYWTTNNAVSIVQSLVLRHDAVRKLLDIPKPPPPDTASHQNSTTQTPINTASAASSSSSSAEMTNKDQPPTSSSSSTSSNVNAFATEAEFVDKKGR